jgi:hypothetical protein
MSLAEIEAELDQLGPDELRRLALKSWTTFVEKERRTDGANECDEDDPRFLAALDEAIDFKVIFKDTFLADLERIVRLIAVHNPSAAQKLGSAP